MTRWPFLALLSCLVAAACGGRSDSDNGGSSDVGSAIPIRGGERLEWDQPTDSSQTARSYTYSLYVDGTPMSMTDIVCADVRSAGGVTCSGRLPAMARGNHRLELSASISGIESSRSSSLSVSLNGMSLVSVGGAPHVAGSYVTRAGVSTVCIEADAQECYENLLLASGLGLVTSVVTTDKELFFVEDGRHVRVIRGDALATEAALILDERRRITALAVPPDFERSRELFVAWTEPARGGGETLNITRYRELQGTLGEAATIVAGLPMTPNGTAPMAVDDRGRIYLALPAESTQTGTPNIAALSNFVLRFDSDGRVPSTNPSGSPVVAFGYGRPASLLWASGTRELWLSGTDSRWSSPVSRLIMDVDGVEWPWRPRQVDVSASGLSLIETLPLLTISTYRDPAWSQDIWLVHGAGELRRAVLRPGGQSVRFHPLRIVGLGPVIDVTNGPGNSLTVITQSEAGGIARKIWRLTPISAGSLTPSNSLR